MSVHYVENSKMKVAYFPETKRFFRVNSKACELIEAFTDHKSKDDIISEFNISEELYQQYSDKIYGNLEKPEIVECENSTQSKIKSLGRLVLHLTNDCNMRCQYCYANGGSYLSKRDIMNQATLDRVLEVFFTEFDQVRNVQLFGGEPLMNMELMEYACEKISNIAKKREYDVTFGLVTNGTLIDRKFIDLVKKYKIMVTVSYDGNPEVNDIMRIISNREGSTNQILKNAKWLKEETGEPNTIEVTYNQHHVEHSVSIMDVVKHIHQELPGTYIHLVPAGGDAKTDYAIRDLSIFAESIHEIVERKKMNMEDSLPVYSLAHRIFTAIENREYNSTNICDAGIGTISVSTKGDVYPCFMFTDNDELCYGSIFDENFFASDKFRDISKKISDFSVKDNNSECSSCFIKPLCNGCLGLNSFHSGSPFKLSSDICEMFRSMTEQALLEYADLAQTDKVQSEE